MYDLLEISMGIPDFTVPKPACATAIIAGEGVVLTADFKSFQ